MTPFDKLMTSQIILIILGTAIVAFLVFRKTRDALRRAKDKVVGICASAIGLGAKKRENKEKIPELLRERGPLSNFDIREALGVSDRSIIRYMDELEREGKVEQVGTTGRSVTYRPK